MNTDARKSWHLGLPDQQTAKRSLVADANVTEDVIQGVEARFIEPGQTVTVANNTRWPCWLRLPIFWRIMPIRRMFL